MFRVNNIYRGLLTRVFTVLFPLQKAASLDAEQGRLQRNGCGHKGQNHMKLDLVSRCR